MKIRATTTSIASRISKVEFMVFYFYCYIICLYLPASLQILLSTAKLLIRFFPICLRWLNLFFKPHVFSRQPSVIRVKYYSWHVIREINSHVVEVLWQPGTTPQLPVITHPHSKTVMRLGTEFIFCKLFNLRFCRVVPKAVDLREAIFQVFGNVNSFYCIGSEFNFSLRPPFVFRFFGRVQKSSIQLFLFLLRTFWTQLK